jgi:hypothetical protein
METRSSWKALSSAVTSLGGGWEREAEVKVTTKVTSSRRPKEKYCILAMIADLVSAFFDRGSLVWGVVEGDAELKSCFSGSANLSPLAEVILLTRYYGQGILEREYA